MPEKSREIREQLEYERSRWDNDNWLRPNARSFERYYVEGVLKLEYERFIAKLGEHGLTFDEFYIRSRVDPEGLLEIDLDGISRPGVQDA